jgi:hypothetical protein
MTFFLPFYRLWNRLSLQVRAMIVILLILTATLSIPGFVKETTPARLHSAQFYFLNHPTVVVGENFSLELRVKTNGTPINAMGFTLLYNPIYVEVVSMTTEKSFCTHYLDNTFDNQKGTITVSCGMPSPGFLGDSLAVRVEMRGRIAGQPAVTASPKTVYLLANDGKGSNIVETSPSTILNIQQL